MTPRIIAEDFVGYEKLVSFMKERELQKLEGDIIEIGVFMGGGTIKLAKFAKKYKRKVFAIDTFETIPDETISKSGILACDVYKAFLEGHSMLDIYRNTTRGFDNIITINQDSMKVNFDKEQKFIFGFVDGCHQSAYISNDFNTIWPHLVPGGAIGFHDYKYDDWPEVTPAVDKLIDEHKNEIKDIVEIEGKYLITSVLLIKK